MIFDVEKVADAIVNQIARATDPLRARIVELEQRLATLESNGKVHRIDRPGSDDKRGAA